MNIPDIIQTESVIETPQIPIILPPIPIVTGTFESSVSKEINAVCNEPSKPIINAIFVT